MTSQEAEELGVSVETAKQAISRNAHPTEGGTPEQISRRVPRRLLLLTSGRPTEETRLRELQDDEL
jgi:hypothetical protein